MTLFSACTKGALKPMLTSEKRGREIWWWADVSFMAAPTLAAFGANSQQPAYWETDGSPVDAGFSSRPRNGTFTIVTSDICLLLPEGEDVREQNGRKYSGRGASAGSRVAIPRLPARYPRTSLPANAIWRNIYC